MKNTSYSVPHVLVQEFGGASVQDPERVRPLPDPPSLHERINPQWTPQASASITAPEPGRVSPFQGSGARTRTGSLDKKAIKRLCWLCIAWIGTVRSQSWTTPSWYDESSCLTAFRGTADTSGEGLVDYIEYYDVFLPSISPYAACPPVWNFGVPAPRVYRNSFLSLACTCRNYAAIVTGSSDCCAFPTWFTDESYPDEYAKQICRATAVLLEQECGNGGSTGGPTPAPSTRITSTPPSFVPSTSTPTMPRSPVTPLATLSVSPTVSPIVLPTSFQSPTPRPGFNQASNPPTRTGAAVVGGEANSGRDNAETTAVAVPLTLGTVGMVLVGLFLFRRHRHRRDDTVVADTSKDIDPTGDETGDPEVVVLSHSQAMKDLLTTLEDDNERLWYHSHACKPEAAAVFVSGTKSKSRQNRKPGKKEHSKNVTQIHNGKNNLFQIETGSKASSDGIFQDTDDDQSDSCLSNSSSEGPNIGTFRPVRGKMSGTDSSSWITDSSEDDLDDTEENDVRDQSSAGRNPWPWELTNMPFKNNSNSSTLAMVPSQSYQLDSSEDERGWSDSVDTSDEEDVDLPLSLCSPRLRLHSQSQTAFTNGSTSEDGPNLGRNDACMDEIAACTPPLLSDDPSIEVALAHNQASCKEHFEQEEAVLDVGDLYIV
jgi:hypothetical protein